MFPAYYSGFADEAGPDLDTQIRATLELGWNAIEMRGVRVPGYDAANLHDIPDEAFEKVAEGLALAGVRVNSLGSALANHGKDISKPFAEEATTARRTAERSQRLGAEFVRVMSYPIGDPTNLHEEERYRRLREFVTIFADAGITVVHENCNNFGGMGWPYALRLLENVPGLKLVFDMGNCVADLDYNQPAPHPCQDAWEFYENVRDHVVYVHIKDAHQGVARDKKLHCFPGEGHGQVRRIVTDLFERGYSGGLSIEPHMYAGLDDASLTHEDNCYQTYLQYGRRLMHMVEEIKQKTALV